MNGHDVVNHAEHKRNRSGISRLVAGPAAGTYCTLVGSFTSKGRQTAVGAHQFGELDGMPLFKVPSNIIPNNDILCVYNGHIDNLLNFWNLLSDYKTIRSESQNYKTRQKK